jgi:LPS export ABC transporter protein LptC
MKRTVVSLLLRRFMRRIEFMRFNPFAPVLISAAITLGGCAGSTEVKPEDVTEEPEAVPAYILKDVTHFQYVSGMLRLKIDFDRGYYYEEAGELRIENCNFVYYDRTEEEISLGRSNKATLYQKDSLLVAEDEVVIVSKTNRTTLETDYLEWWGGESRFVTDSFVTITRENGDRLQGIGMITDVALNYVTIKKDVRGSFSPQ